MPTEVDLSREPVYVAAWPLPEDTPDPTGHLEGLQGVLALARKAVRDFVEQRAEVHGDLNLSADGKVNRVKAIARGILRGLQEATARRDKADTAAQEMESGLAREAEAAASDVLGILRQQEVRAEYRKLDGSERLEVVRVALAAGDRETLGALLGAPRAFPLLTPKIREAVELELLKKANAAAFSELERLREGLAVASAALERAEGWIKAESGLAGEEDPRERMERASTV